MRDIIDVLEAWIDSGEPVVTATVVSTWGSSPRKSGSKMAVRGDGTMIGSVSGGCVEGAVAETAMQVLEGAPPQLLKFGVSDETAWGVGLACGGSIEVFVQKLDAPVFRAAANHIRSDQSLAILTQIEGAGDEVGRQLLIGRDGKPLAGDESILDDPLQDVIGRAFQRGQSARLDLGAKDSAIFIDLMPAPRRLVMIGGVHISIALAGMAKTLGFKTIVVDPRRLFASAERFPDVDLLIPSWPQDAYEQIVLDHETAVAVLTHDPKIDDPAIIGALDSPAFYIGVLGSRKTHNRRLGRLKEAGIDDEQLARLHAPIGLDIGAQSPEEIALSILAEITASQRLERIPA